MPAGGPRWKTHAQASGGYSPLWRRWSRSWKTRQTAGPRPRANRFRPALWKACRLALHPMEITMPAPKIRADYEQLTQIAIAFARHAALTRQTLQHLRQQQDTLRGGDWQGEGAQAFQAEMDTQVAPRLNRLVQALEAANETTLQVRASMPAAEEEAARLLRAHGAPNQAGAVGAAVS